MELSRRAFIVGLAAAVGPAAALAAAEALGAPLVPRGDPALAERVRAQSADLGRGRSVAVVGAGIASLVTAYELARLGFNVSVLEAGPKYRTPTTAPGSPIPSRR